MHIDFSVHMHNVNLLCHDSFTDKINICYNSNIKSRLAKCTRTWKTMHICIHVYSVHVNTLHFAQQK